ncbi:MULTISPECIES: MurR/RpiR family transcriptional regulator [Brevibacillus]|uniref:RpiR family transcriptional regulator n=1 Tax=Brevibacillus borstelensis AK1 TaxID=1300222 RepID=M8DDM8_9BACL|nr:MurR/RpiR family transcriptional regulator [Brevibacillus borstelensis]EMT51548.1 RpiR family transcriptional regulator [Brevibacillus borstelensis AK1]WNF06905.1 MurR/RpiR family transcriptional regulator [Brevibacillus borstelensis]GED51439.1 putative HTH-type transcriptional regulator [Brevibacillus borstelensis]
MLSGGLLRIREYLQDIKPSERSVAEYILEHPREVIRMSVKELAERSNASPAAIIRMCKSMGLEGFPELKIRIAADLQSPSAGEDEYKEIRPTDDIPTLIESVTANHIFSLRETIKVLDPTAVEQAVRAMYRARRIDFFGVGASQLVAQDAQQKFLRINKMSTAHADAHLQITSAVTLTDKDVAVGISYSGETRQVLSAIKRAREAGAVTIGITKFGQNSMSALADIHLATVSSEADMRSAATSSRIAQLAVIDMLFMGVAAQSYDKAVSSLRKTRQAVLAEFRTD